MRLQIGRNWRRAFAWFSATNLLLLLLHTVPVIRYRPNANIDGCEKQAVDAPLRPFIANMLEKFLLRDHVRHLRIGDSIYIPMGEAPWEWWRGAYVEHFNNTDGKIARSVATGFIRPRHPRRGRTVDRAMGGQAWRRARPQSGWHPHAQCRVPAGMERCPVRPHSRRNDHRRRLGERSTMAVRGQGHLTSRSRLSPRRQTGSRRPRIP
jgi:hypothetical protein